MIPYLKQDRGELTVGGGGGSSVGPVHSGAEVPNAANAHGNGNPFVGHPAGNGGGGAPLRSRCWPCPPPAGPTSCPRSRSASSGRR